MSLLLGHFRHYCFYNLSNFHYKIQENKIHPCLYTLKDEENCNVQKMTDL